MFEGSTVVLSSAEGSAISLAQWLRSGGAECLLEYCALHAGNQPGNLLDSLQQLPFAQPDLSHRVVSMRLKCENLILAMHPGCEEEAG